MLSGLVIGGFADQVGDLDRVRDQGGMAGGHRNAGRSHAFGKRPHHPRWPFYAGFVVTEAVNAPNVTGVVYVSSYGPDQGESHDDLVKRFPAPAGLPAIRLDENGFLWIARDRFHEAFEHDVDLPQADIMAVVQKPVSKKNCFGVRVGVPAWKSKPSWFVISSDDRLVNPELQKFVVLCAEATRGGDIVVDATAVVADYDAEFLGQIFNLDFDGGGLGMTERSLGRIGQNGNHRGW